MRTLYHVTTRDRAAKIRGLGVLNTMSEGKRAWSYWVDEERLTWALAHVSVRRDVPVSALVIVVANHPEDELIRTGRSGVFARDVAVRPSDIRPVGRMFVTSDGDLEPVL